MLPERGQRILSHIRRDGRKSVASIAREENIPICIAYQHLKRLEEDIITRYVSLIDFREVGLTFRSFIYCKNKSVTEHLKKLPWSNTVFRTKEGVGADIVFPTLSDETDLLEHLEEQDVDYSMHRIIRPVAEEVLIPGGRADEPAQKLKMKKSDPVHDIIHDVT